MEASASCSAGLDVDSSTSATNTDGPVASATSEHRVGFAVEGQSVSLSCSGSFSSSTAGVNSGALLVWIDSGTQLDNRLVTASASQTVDVSKSFGANESHELLMRTSSIADEIGGVTASSNITCDFDGPIAIDPNID